MTRKYVRRSRESHQQRAYLWLSGIIATLCFSASANGQKFWETKPYTDWSANEAEQLLTFSPWAQAISVSETLRSRAYSYVAFIRLFSALPVRQALLRKKQVEMNYAKFTAADKERFDKETKEFVECDDCVKNYILTIRTPKGPLNSDATAVEDIMWMLAGLSLADVKPYVHLVNDAGEQRELAHFVPPAKPNGEAVFVFPRMDATGKVLISATNKKFYLKIDEKLFKSAAALPRVTFEVSKMLFKGQAAL